MSKRWWGFSCLVTEMCLLEDRNVLSAVLYEEIRTPPCSIQGHICLLNVMGGMGVAGSLRAIQMLRLGAHASVLFLQPPHGPSPLPQSPGW